MSAAENNFNNPSAWKIPSEVELSEITVRDGFQSLETIISTEDKVDFLERIILAGFKRVEVSNYAHPKLVPFFNDVDEVFKRLLNSEKVGHMLKQNVSPDQRAKGDFVELTAVSITRKAAERALDSFQKGYGPDRILMMVSTDPVHHKRNSGTELDEYWVLCEEMINAAHKLGILFNGTVSTIWGSPYKEFEPTDEKAVDFVKRFLHIGADDIEHADHDGSLTDPAGSFRYYSKITDPAIMGVDSNGRDLSDPKLHVAHFHTKNMIQGLSNVLGALRAGIVRFESTLTGIGGEPANKVDGVMIPGRPEYYSTHFNHGLVSTEDIVHLFNMMRIKTGIDYEQLKALSIDMTKLLDKFNESQVAHGQETMPNRSYMLTRGELPKQVLELAGV